MDVVINAHCPLSRETKYTRAPSDTIWLPGASRPVCVSWVTFSTCGSAVGQYRHTRPAAKVAAARRAKKAIQARRCSLGQSGDSVEMRMSVLTGISAGGDDC